jgi:hypothetical protein
VNPDGPCGLVANNLVSLANNVSRRACPWQLKWAENRIDCNPRLF